MIVMRKVILAVIAVFIAWSILDFLIHGVLLQSTYQATAQLWRPIGQMKMGLMYLVTFISAATFVSLYVVLVLPKSVSSGLIYGLLFGIATGFPMGFGTYSFMPVPLNLAFTWFIGSLVETVVGGLIVGALIKENPA
jgi:hypothetical protein